MLEQINKIQDETQKEFTSRLYEWEQKNNKEIDSTNMLLPLVIGKDMIDNETVTKETIMIWTQQYTSARALLQKGATNETVIQEGIKAIEEKTGKKIDEADKAEIEKQILDLCAKSGLNLAEPLNEDYDLTKIIK